MQLSMRSSFRLPAARLQAACSSLSLMVLQLFDFLIREEHVILLCGGICIYSSLCLDLKYILL